MKEVKTIILKDEKRIQSYFNKVSLVVGSLNEIQKAYIEIFGNFDIDVLADLFYLKKPLRTATEEYIVVKKINVGDLDIEQVIKMNLVKMPSFDGMISHINSVKKNILVTDEYNFIQNIRDLFDSDLGKFIKPDETENNPVKKRILDLFSVSTESEQENEFIEEILSFAEMYKKLIHQYKVIPDTQIPGEPFILITPYATGVTSTHIPPSTLKKYRDKLTQGKNTNRFLS